MSGSRVASHEAAGQVQDADDDFLRGGVYRLLSRLFAAPPDAALIDHLTRIDADPADGPLAGAWAALATAARAAEPEALDDEYHDLFIGLGRGEVMPFGSWYLTGFLMGRPLVKLRSDLARLGFERADGVHEPEDHISALLDVMALMADPQTPVPLATQRDFFTAHIGAWVERFMKDVREAESARFYRAVGELGERFATVEKQYLDLAA